MLKDLWKVLTGELSSARLKALDSEVVDQHRYVITTRQEADEHRAQNLRLVQQLRQMDQLIFNMSQKTSWEEMRPFFRDAEQLVARRMQVENNRIRTLMVEEVKKAYNE